MRKGGTGFFIDVNFGKSTNIGQTMNPVKALFFLLLFFTLQALVPIFQSELTGQTQQTEWYPGGGKKAEGVELEGKPQGKWTFYHPNGSVKSKIDYQKKTAVHFNEMGNIIAKGALSDAGGSGTWKTFHDNGKPEQQKKYLSGMPHGIWKSWYINGKTAAVQAFSKGKRVGTWMNYSRTGTTTFKGSFNEDKPIGIWTYFWDGGEPKMTIDYEKGATKGWYQDGTVQVEGDGSPNQPAGKWAWF